MALKRNRTSPRRSCSEGVAAARDGSDIPVTASEIRAKFAGIVFVGDSQLRENAWATMRWLSESQLLRYAHAGEAWNNTRNCPRVGCGGRVVANVCLPEAAGRLGFTATCGPALPRLALLRRPRLTWRRLPPTLFCPKSASPSTGVPASSRRARIGARPDSGRRRPTTASSSRRSARGKSATSSCCASTATAAGGTARCGRRAIPSPARRCALPTFCALRGDLGRRRRRPVVAAELSARAPPAPQEAASVGGAGGGLHELIVCDPPPLTQRHGDAAPRTVVSTTAALLQRARRGRLPAGRERLLGEAVHRRARA